MEDITPPTKKHRNASTQSTPVRATRLQKRIARVANECDDNVQALRARQKALRLQYEAENEKLDLEVNSIGVIYLFNLFLLILLLFLLLQIMQEQSTAANAATAASIKLVNKCSTKRARAETRKRIKEKEKAQQSKKKNTKTRVPYTKHHRNNALDAIIESYYHHDKTVSPLSVRKAASLYLDGKYKTLQRCVNKFQVIKKIETMKKYVESLLT